MSKEEKKKVEIPLSLGLLCKIEDEKNEKIIQLERELEKVKNETFEDTIRRLVNTTLREYQEIYV